MILLGFYFVGFFASLIVVIPLVTVLNARQIASISADIRC